MTVDAAIVIVLLQTRIDVRDLKEMPPDTDRSMGNGAMDRGLHAEPLVVSVTALQPSLRR